MIRATIDLHVVSRGSDGSYWLSTIPQHAYLNYKEKLKCKDDADLRVELRDMGVSFVRVASGIPPWEAIQLRIGYDAQVTQITQWPGKIDLESELTEGDKHEG